MSSLLPVEIKNITRSTNITCVIYVRTRHRKFFFRWNSCKRDFHVDLPVTCVTSFIFCLKQFNQFPRAEFSRWNVCKIILLWCCLANACRHEFYCEMREPTCNFYITARKKLRCRPANFQKFLLRAGTLFMTLRVSIPPSTPFTLPLALIYAVFIK